MKKLLALTLLSFGLSNNLQAAEYKVDPAASKIEFTGSQEGKSFKGKFEKWDASINFDPNDLANSKISVSIDTASAKTGDSMFDSSMPGDDWFNVKMFPKAQYTSDKITKDADGSYMCEGNLTILNKTVPTKFKFTLKPADLATSPVTTSFSLTLNRLAFDLGSKQDSKGDTIGLDVKVDVSLSAVKK